MSLTFLSVIYSILFFLKPSMLQEILLADDEIITPFHNGTFEDILATFDSNRELNVWERTSLETQNSFRYAHQLRSLRWSDFMLSLADTRALQIIYSSETIRYDRDDLTSQFFQPGEITFSERMLTFSIPEALLSQPHEIPGFLADQVESILRYWYLEGVFNLSRSNGYFEQMLDPYSDYMGSSLRISTAGNLSIKMVIVVAYHNMLKNTPSERGMTLRALSSYRSCRVTCSEIETCLSLRPKNVLLFRAGERTSISRVDTCNCLEAGNDQTYPLCTGTCFVNCPLALHSAQKTCHGKMWCRCSASDKAATCF